MHRQYVDSLIQVLCRLTRLRPAMFDRCFSTLVSRDGTWRNLGKRFGRLPIRIKSGGTAISSATVCKGAPQFENGLGAWISRRKNTIGLNKKTIFATSISPTTLIAKTCYY